MRLLDFLFPPREDEEELRGTSVDEFLSLLSPRLVPGTRPETTALLSFGVPIVRAAIHEAKYHGSELAFHYLGAALAEYLRDTDEGYRAPLIVPMPLSSVRKRKRGYNQVEEVVRRATDELGLEIDTPFLVRTRETVSQVSLPRHKRELNMKDAFRALHPADPARTYLLIDDVVTTGATLQAAIDALSEAGATHIVPLALAH